MLRGDELVAAGTPPGPKVRPELLIAFFRALIKNTMNGDVIAIALMRARSESGASEEEVQALVQAIRNERPACNCSDMSRHVSTQRRRPWPYQWPISDC